MLLYILKWHLIERGEIRRYIYTKIAACCSFYGQTIRALTIPRSVQPTLNQKVKVNFILN